MIKDLAVKPIAVSQHDMNFNNLRPVVERTVPEDFVDPAILLAVFDRLAASFADDYAGAGDLRGLLFGTDADAYSPGVAALFQSWEDGQAIPSLPAIIAHAIDSFALDPDAAGTRAALLSAVLAEYPNDLQYHGNAHYRKVVIHTIRLIATHNQMYAGTEEALSGDQVALLLAASCIHDLGHEGGDNLKNGVYTPGLMEQRACDIARPYFEMLGLDRDDIGIIETMVFCTDITFFAGDNSPCLRLKKIFKHVFWDDDSDDISMMLMGKLRRYEDNAPLVLMAMFLHEADIASSAGVGYEQTIHETVNIMEERGVYIAGPKIVLAFLREQLGESMFTQAARRLFGRAMTDVIAQAEQDLQNGRESFYDEA